jgi:formamidopyrimidine-DNA glycosylase
MPELPEVETIVRGLAPRLAGRRIVNAEGLSALVAPGDLGWLRGRAITGVRRHGKFIVIDLQPGPDALAIHLGMTGKLLTAGGLTPYTRAVFTLDQGTLYYDDIRQFGRIEKAGPRVLRLGPDPFEIGEAEFVARLRSRRAMVKPLLLNQTFLRGMGNIYTDEALSRAGIHPRALSNRVSRERAARLYRAMVEVLSESIARGGSSISDYVDADGRAGAFQLLHRVYGREGEPCMACGTAIRRVVIAQRGTHFCPRCQKR